MTHHYDVTESTSNDPSRCYLKGFGMGKATRATGLTAGYPAGIPPPPPSNHPWYTQSRTVLYTFTGAKSAHEVGEGSGSEGGGGAGERGGGTLRATEAKLRMINSTCANPKAMWEGEMNSTTWPSAEQLAKLRTASEYCEETVSVTWSSAGVATVEVVLEAYAAAELLLPLP